MSPKPDEPAPEQTGSKQLDSEASAVGVVKCLLVGSGVGLAAIPICMVLQVFFYALRELGILLMLMLIPIGAIATWYVTRAYLRRSTNRVRGAVAFACRYFFLGAALGLFFLSCVCCATATALFGGVIGAISGGIGGAFYGWRHSRRQNGVGKNTASMLENNPLELM
jgi:hypothetical protein